MKILKGTTFGDWLTLEDSKEEKVLARCKCGVERRVKNYTLQKLNSKCCNTGSCNKTRKPMTGKVYGQLTVLEDYLPNKRIRVQCSCGNIVLKDKEQVAAGVTKSCQLGLCKTGVKDITGKIFGYFKVEKISDKKYKGSHLWECICICGNRKVLRAGPLQDGRLVSCGCRRIMRQSKKTKEEVSIQQLFSHYRRQAIARNISFQLSKKEFINYITQDCFYCGVRGGNKYKAQRSAGEIFEYNGIDRIDSSKDYFVENCVPSCGFCNKAKNTKSHDEFITYIKKISARFPDVPPFKPISSPSGPQNP